MVNGLEVFTAILGISVFLIAGVCFYLSVKVQELSFDLNDLQKESIRIWKCHKSSEDLNIALFSALSKKLMERAEFDRIIENNFKK